MKPLAQIPFRPAGARRAGGFSLVEVTLALGIAVFSLVGIVGVLPTALNSSRRSIDKSRAALIADTLFASFRSQPFQNVGYVDSQFDKDGALSPGAYPTPLDLNAANNPEVDFYATFLDVSTPASAANDAFGPQRRMLFSTGTTGGADYLVKMHFNSTPSGMAITPVAPTANAQPTVPAQANQIELVISSTGRTADQYRFVSTVANRTN